MGKDKYMDGFKYDVPAEKLGYIQKLGAARMAPGKKGDLTAMKMMHGDAAAKYYDGGDVHMNGAPKHVGASKSYVGPATHIDGKTDLGHNDSVSFKIDPDKGASAEGTITSSSGGATSSGTSYTEAYKKADKKKYPTLESFTKAAKEYNIKNKPSSGSTSSRSFSQKNPETPKEIDRQANLSLSEVIAKDNMKRYALENRAKQDSIKFDHAKRIQLMKENPSRDPITMDAISVIAGRAGNAAANRSREASNLPQVSRTGGGWGESRSTTTGQWLHNYNRGSALDSDVFQVKDSQNKSGVSGAVGNEGEDSKYRQRPQSIMDPRYKREGTLYTELPAGAPKVDHSPMKFGMNSSKSSK